MAYGIARKNKDNTPRPQTDPAGWVVRGRDGKTVETGFASYEAAQKAIDKIIAGTAVSYGSNIAERTSILRFRRGMLFPCRA